MLFTVYLSLQLEDFQVLLVQFLSYHIEWRIVDFPLQIRVAGISLVQARLMFIEGRLQPLFIALKPEFLFFEPLLSLNDFVFLVGELSGCLCQLMLQLFLHRDDLFFSPTQLLALLTELRFDRGESLQCL